MADDEWKLFRKVPRDDAGTAIDLLKQEVPPWRDFSRKTHRARTYQPGDTEIEMVNAALYLRRPLLVTGNPGIGKSSLIYAVADQLHLGEVLVWPITSRTTVRDGLYQYDAVARLRDLQLAKLRVDKAPEPAAAAADKAPEPPEQEAAALARYLRLGPLGTALLPSDRPRALLIDEVDKGDVDFANDLLHVFEEGNFEIPEARRVHGDADGEGSKGRSVISIPTADAPDSHDRLRRAEIEGGMVQCRSFPFVVLTSNGERELPPAFLRRCIRLELTPPGKQQLTAIVKAHFVDRLGKNGEFPKEVKKLVDEIIDQVAQVNEAGGDARSRRVLATDQLLNTLLFVMGGVRPKKDEFESLRKLLLRELGK